MTIINQMNKLECFKDFEIVTSYFAQYKNLKADGYFVIAISRTAPINCCDTMYNDLMPSAELLWWAKSIENSIENKYLLKEKIPDYIKQYKKKKNT